MTNLTPVRVAARAVALLSPELEYANGGHRSSKASADVERRAVVQLGDMYFKVESLNGLKWHHAHLESMNCDCEDYCFRGRGMCHHLIASAIKYATLRYETGLEVAAGTVEVLSRLTAKKMGWRPHPILKALRRQSGVVQVEDGIFKVQEGLRFYVVNLPALECHCHEWHYGLTCWHVMAAALWQANQGDEVCTND